MCCTNEGNMPNRTERQPNFANMSNLHYCCIAKMAYKVYEHVLPVVGPVADNVSDWETLSDEVRESFANKARLYLTNVTTPQTFADQIYAAVAKAITAV